MNKQYNDNFKSKIHFFLLYEDNEKHMNAIKHIFKFYNFGGIRHDNDLWTEEDEKENPLHKAGTHKKVHWHFVVKFENARYRSAVCKKLGIEERFDKCIETELWGLKYLIHYEYEDKYQYSLDDVCGELRFNLIHFLERKCKKEDRIVLTILDYLDMQPMVSYSKIIKWACQNGYWSELRRGGIWLQKCIDEHNQRYIEKLNNNIKYEKSLKEFEELKLRI